ncbi:MAG: trigger factor [Spirochaetota bacterium]|nr:trigger factor [Spirochaetota bacterium]OPZ38200.1 MAG: Trigger factor [Spirochaetes bacterium ADurb.BinA120]HPV96352.1 trigger factor [Spirochaetota bacterium]
MIISEKKLENAQMELHIDVPENRVEIEYKSVFERIRNNARIDGYRKGKAPLELIERKFVDMADQEVAENILRSEYQEAVIEKNYTPISPPSFNFDRIKRGEGFSFTVVFETMPVIELGDYRGLKVNERTCKITEDDVKREIETLRERHANISKKEGDDARVEKGDMIRIGIKRIDNVEPERVEGLEFKEYNMIVGKSRSEYGFDGDVLGMKSGERKETKIKYPKDYEVRDLAGQTARYIIRVDEINRMDLPALDDEFAKDLGEYSSLDEMKNGIRAKLEKFVTEKAKSEAKGKLLREAVAKSGFDLPASMVRKEMGALFQRVQERTGYFSEDINEFAATLGLNVEEFSGSLRTEAESNIKSTLLLSKIAEKEELKVPEDKYREVVEGIAKRNNSSVEELERIISQNNSRESIESDLVMESALELIYENAKIDRAKPESLDEFIKSE